jgi:hypothetical protein
MGGVEGAWIGDSGGSFGGRGGGAGGLPALGGGGLVWQQVHTLHAHATRHTLPYTRSMRHPATPSPTFCNTLQHILQHATHFPTLCNNLQHITQNSATLCNILQHIPQHFPQYSATRYNTLQPIPQQAAPCCKRLLQPAACRRARHTAMAALHLISPRCTLSGGGGGRARVTRA